MLLVQLLFPFDARWSPPGGPLDPFAAESQRHWAVQQAQQQQGGPNHNQMTILGPRFLNEKLDGGDPLNKHDIFQVKETTSSILKDEKMQDIERATLQRHIERATLFYI